MAEIQYSITPVSPAGYTDISPEDANLSTQVTLPSTFDSAKNFIDLVITSPDGVFLNSVNGYGGAKELGDSNSSNAEGANTLYIDPQVDSQVYGQDAPDTVLTYYFLNSLFLNPFFVKEISDDRTELKVASVSQTYNFIPEYTQVKQRLETDLYFNELRLSFGSNQYIIAVNIDIAEDGDLLLKLYDALPAGLTTKSIFSIVEEVADPIAFAVSAIFIPDAERPQYLKGPNFTIDSEQDSATATEYLDYDTLLSYPVTGSYHKIFTLLSSSGVELNIDYGDYSNFVHFSSAYERLANFKYKLDLISDYQTKKALTGSLANAASAVTASNIYYDNLISGILSKFDGYEQYLYFESSSATWPKSNSTAPYLNQTSSAAEATAWFTAQASSASLYDELNQSRLVYTVPEFIRQDDSNTPYLLFLDMVGQHFDSLWVYSKALTQKYNADNRIDYGVSKELIEPVLRNFGVKLYSSNFSTTNLASLMLGEWYDSGSEQITTFVTASNSPTPDQEILTETYKRIYHNLPYLLKTKGTERGLRALVNCFGIPSSSLSINVYGGKSREEVPYLVQELPNTQTKIRLDNTGSLVAGSTLSHYTEVVKNSDKYNQDLHVVEVGFSPTTYLNAYISSSSTASLDDYIGDPRYLHASSYTGLSGSDLEKYAQTILSGSAPYDLQDFIRMTKFFDNQLFKMVKDFIPGRDAATTGVIIKPHVLERSKVKSPEMSFTQPEYTGSIDTAFVEGYNGGVLADYSTAHTASLVTPAGPVSQIESTHIEKLNGELDGTTFDMYAGSLNIDNPFLINEAPELTYELTQYLSDETPSAGAGELSEEDFFNTIPLGSGDMYYYWAYSKGGYNYLKYIWFRHTSHNNVDVTNAVREFTKITVNSTTYSGFEKNIRNNNTILILPDPGSGTSLNPASYPTTAAVVPVQLFPYIAQRFDNSDYNALFNNASAVSNTVNVSKVNYTDSPLIPSNIAALRANTAEKAQVQEYIYNSAGIVRGKYIGKQLTSRQLNEWQLGDISFGKTPSVEQKTPYFCVFDYISGFSPEHNNANAIAILYIVDEDGNILTPDVPEAQAILQQSFRTNSKAMITVQGADPAGSEATLLGEQAILRGGSRIEPILYSYTASSPFQDPSYIPGYKLEFRTRASLITYDTIATGSVQAPNKTYDVTTKILFQKDLKNDAGYYDRTASTFYFLEDSKQPVKFKATIASTGSGVPIGAFTQPANTFVQFQIERSSDSSFSAGTTTTLSVQTAGYIFPTARTIQLESAYLNFNSGSAIRVTVTPLDTNLNTLQLTSTTFQAVSEQSGSTFVSQSDNGQGYFFSLGAGNVLTGSLTLSSKYENTFIGVSGAIAPGFNTVTQPFTVQPGDEIKFNGDESQVFSITGVQSPYENPQKTLYLTLDRRPNTAVSASFFAIRRYVDTSNTVLMRTDRIAGTQKDGILYPKYPSDRLRANYPEILSNLKNKGIL